ncbi:hypothetical protein [Bacillus haynesii]|uniref:hypothetical protein n=1 Tax=Bacillus haynesii TaxID=1925021 RepID=UPI002280FDED|nr:hypothetical protein [Bacillus haynesii]MCY7990976.1 hypothetical protein [Bacillus haynesii]
MQIVILLGALLTLNFIYQLSNSIRCGKLIEWYEKWLLDKNFNKDLNEYRTEVKKLVDRAGLKGLKIPYEEPIGFGHIRTMTISPIDQFPFRDQKIAITILRTLSAAKGVYKRRMWASFNPIAWLETVVFLPSILLNYLGLEKDKLLAKFFNMVWWIVVVIAIPILITTYAAEIGSFVRSIFKKDYEFILNKERCKNGKCLN